jgi:hypothetical protein
MHLTEQFGNAQLLKIGQSCDEFGKDQEWRDSSVATLILNDVENKVRWNAPYRDHLHWRIWKCALLKKSLSHRDSISAAMKAAYAIVYWIR